MSLSIVIIEYQSLDEIDHCVKNLLPHLPEDSEVIISSNSLYPEEEQSRIRKMYPEVTWLFNEKNGGFAYAMNEGLKHASKEYMAIMNPDCIALSDLTPLVDYIDQHKGIGAIAPKMIDDEGNVQDSARPYVTPFRFFKRQMKRILLHRSDDADHSTDYSKLQTIDWIIGAFILVSREVYNRTGGLSDDYFMYAEDLDWCTRIRKAGFEIVYYPDVVIRYEGTRRARSSKKYAKIFLESHIKYWKKFGFFSFQLPKRVSLESI